MCGHLSVGDPYLCQGIRPERRGRTLLRKPSSPLGENNEKKDLGKKTPDIGTPAT